VDTELQKADAEKRDVAPVSTAVELERAAKICAQSKQAVISMFQEARMGKAVDTGGATETGRGNCGFGGPQSWCLDQPGAPENHGRLHLHAFGGCVRHDGGLGQAIGLGRRANALAGMAGLMHDLGKALMPMDVLNKPGKLTDAEFAIIKTHPVEGHRLLLTGRTSTRWCWMCACTTTKKPMVRVIPRASRRDEISLFAKMGAVCDVYDAITSNRPYKSGWDPAESLRKMAEWANGHVLAQLPLGDGVAVHFVRAVGKAQRACVT
jgi:hypothetical protein